MTILVELKDVYGERKVYPVCDKAKTFAVIAGTRTLTPATLNLIKDLGYTVNVKASQPTTL